jgi:hypothetical protein
MHPIERLRYVARAGGLDLVELVQDAALALGGFADDPVALVTACRSLVDRHPAAGPIWWLTARVLVAADPASEAWRLVEEIETDDTARTVARELPDGARILVVGWPEVVVAGLRRRGDCELLVVDPEGAYRRSSIEAVRRGGPLVQEVPEAGVAAAAAQVDLVLFEAQAIGDAGLVAVMGTRAAAAVAAAGGTPVWAVAPVGRMLPSGLWRVLAERLGDVAEPWLEPDELVPLDLVSGVLRPTGLLMPADAAADPDCPFAPELVRPLDAPGSHR